MNRRLRGKVVIVDWDDTILPSTFVDRWQIDNSRDLPLHFQNLLATLAECADRFLAEASKYGEVILITNSDEGWVQFSAEKYCPKLLPVVAKYRIVSARTRYEKFYPGQPLCWKAAAFAHEVNEIYEKLKENDSASSCGSMEGTDVSSTSSMGSLMMDDEEEDATAAVVMNDDSFEQQQLSREIISFGDSNEERTAVKIVSGQLDARSKSVKFLPAPTLLQIIGQLYMLTNHMQFVIDSEKALDMHITQQQADQCAESYLREHGIHYDENIVPNYIPRSRKTVGEVLARNNIMSFSSTRTPAFL
ncbi:hypothetical protein IV203_028824 [Nitzschia inconspicua]|uniref:Apicomplexan-conserved protein n=1 Tax=Nitzschia inconspicua TaxID=303405 RepID=A0A9K3LPC6_9STRA|nr:hypothetical protein IV203_004760 [Nitzschia inconspicua]KAG7366154.1 hypothetical protein IV203_028824 [Nitzschia inconspicua]